MVKKILVGIVFLVAIAAAAAYYLNANLDTIVQAAIEKYGSEATKTSVRVENVKIVGTSGQASLSGLSVGSPEGFEAEKSVYLGQISVKLDTKSITGNGPIVVKEILIDKPQVTYEINNSGEANLQAISKNAKAYAGSFSKDKKAEKTSANAEKSEGRKVIIENLTVRDGQVSVSQALLKGKKIEAALPAIHLTNIGKNEGGATYAEVAETLFGAVSNASAQVASSNLSKELVDKAKNISKDDLEKTGGEVLNSLFGK